MGRSSARVYAESESRSRVLASHLSAGLTAMPLGGSLKDCEYRPRALGTTCKEVADPRFHRDGRTGVIVCEARSRLLARSDVLLTSVET